VLTIWARHVIDRNWQPAVEKPDSTLLRCCQLFFVFSLFHERCSNKHPWWKKSKKWTLRSTQEPMALSLHTSAPEPLASRSLHLENNICYPIEILLWTNLYVTCGQRHAKWNHQSWLIFHNQEEVSLHISNGVLKLKILLSAWTDTLNHSKGWEPLKY
jgi:hypothetical protein